LSIKSKSDFAKSLALSKFELHSYLLVGSGLHAFKRPSSSVSLLPNSAFLSLLALI